MRVDKFEDPVKSDNPFLVCDAFLNSSDGTYLLAGDWKLKFREALDIMFNSIEKLEHDQELPEDFSYSKIEDCLNFLMHLPKERNNTEVQTNFIKAFVFLAYNLNNNLDKNEIVDDKIKYLNRYCDNALTYVETLKLMSNVSSRLSVWREWSSPSFRLSGHYYNLLKGE